LRQSGSLAAPTTTPSGTVVIDLETADAARQYDHPDPAGFVRLAGYSTPDGPRATTDPKIVIDQLLSSQWVVGSNLIHFDLPVLGRIDPRVDVLELTRQNRVLDTMVTESVLMPIMNDKRPQAVGRAMKHFKLDAACARYGIPGKTNDLKAMAKEAGGFDQIKIADLEPYLIGDVAATEGLKEVLTRMLMKAPASLRSYTFREHRVHAIAAQMGIEGFAVDQELLPARHEEAKARKQELSQRLIDKYGIPTVKADGKPAKSPAATKEGKEAILAALNSLGVDTEDIPKTEKKSVSFGGDAMDEVIRLYAEHANAVEIGLLCDTVGDVAGVRTVYKTAMDHLHADGRVHPQVATFQASGRWSVGKPGLTVFGKRGIGADGFPRVREREVFVASDDDHVLFTIDLSQVDARSVAVLSQDHDYMDIFGLDEDGNPRDSHAEVALRVWGDKSQRERAKPISHGWNYNMGLNKLTEVAGSRAVAEQFHNAMVASFPRLIAWKQEMVDLAESGAWMDNGFGRLMRPDPDRAFTQGPALAGQGLARDLMMKCLLNIDDLDPRVIKMLRAQIHDEAIFEFPRRDAEELKRLVVSCFNYEWAPPHIPNARPIQLMADAGKFGRSWAECY